MSLKHSAPPAPRAGRGLVIASLAVASLAARPAAAQTDYYNTDAGRPITVEDAYPVERRAVELQLAPLRLERVRGGTYHWGVEPEVAVGILPRTRSRRSGASCSSTARRSTGYASSTVMGRPASVL